ncbi:MAG: fumarylacetoacetase [Calditrichia bacterium]
MQSYISIDSNSFFTIHNLPYGIFSPAGSGEKRVGVAIGEQVLDLAFLEAKGFFKEQLGTETAFFAQSSLNHFMALGKKSWRAVRSRLQDLLSVENQELQGVSELRERAFFLLSGVKLYLPVEIGDYTDFYSSKEHATNVGIMFRGKENALMPNWLHLPVAYHGRASSIVVSGTNLHRPKGQILPPDQETPIYSPSRLLDFELEMGFFIGPGNTLGEPISVTAAEEHIFGLVLVNDWSARDIQKWEYQPLGPFLSKNFGTSISPWVVTLDALEPFRVAGPEQEPEPLPYLRQTRPFSYDIHLEVLLQTPQMAKPERISLSNFKYMYWSMAQQLAHHTVNGCNLRTGDMLASGTISGPDAGAYGSLLELTWRGSKPLQLSNGESRKFLEDGDTVIIRGWSKKNDVRIGFGEVRGTILPAK